MPMNEDYTDVANEHTYKAGINKLSVKNTKRLVHVNSGSTLQPPRMNKSRATSQSNSDLLNNRLIAQTAQFGKR